MAATSDTNVISLISDGIQALDKELRDINYKARSIHSHPELCYNEHQAHDNIVALLRSQGLDVTPQAYGLDTAFEATYGTGGRLVTYNAEYDALPEIGHACGHNLIATGSVAAFFGVVSLLKAHPTIQGRVRLLGTPAEEGGAGKVKLIDAGAYKNVDACLMSHPMSGVPLPSHFAGLAYVTSIASSKFRATFTGKLAHAAAAPQDGINALDAAVLAYNGVSMLRQQILPSQRIGGVIMEGGEKANVIPSRAVMDYNVRSADVGSNEVLQGRVVKCFEGAAVATGCKVAFEQYDFSLLRLPGPVRHPSDNSRTNAYAEVVPNRTLCAAYASTLNHLGLPQTPFDKTSPISESTPMPGSYSTDQGNVSYVCPSIHAVYRIPAPDKVANHTPEFTAAAITEEAYNLTIKSAVGLAVTGWKVLSDERFAREVREEFEERFKGYWT